MGCHFLLQRIFPTQGSTHASYVSCTGSRLFTTDAHLKFFQFFLFLLVNHLLSVQLGWVGRDRGRKETSYLSCTRCKALSLGTQCCAVLSRSVSNSATPWTGSSVHGDSSGKNTGVGCHFLLQGIFLTQGLNPGLPHCRQILYRLSHHGNRNSIHYFILPSSSPP